MTGFPLSPEPGSIADAANLALQGKINSTGTFTLTANQATSTLTNYYLTTESKVFFFPTTANAAAEIGAGTMYSSTKNDGSWTITHANNAQADRTFDYVVLA